MAHSITIDAEFRALIPSLSQEEHEQLLANIMRDGVLSPFVVWKEEDVLLEGHHRFDICQQNDLPFPEPKRLSFKSRDEAKVWMIKHQFGRRNLQPFQRVELALKLEPLLAAKGKANQRAGGGGGKAGCQKSDKVVASIDTKKELAKIAGVSHDTIAKGKVLAATASEETKAKLRTGEESINRAYRAAKPSKAGSNGHASNGSEKPPPKYFSSDLFDEWLDEVISMAASIDDQYGGLEKLLDEPTWDHRRDGFMFPKLDGLEAVIARFIKETKQWEKGRRKKTS